MAQRHEVEAWVNPQAWDDQDAARQAIDAIIDSGSDNEADWVRIAGGGSDDVLLAVSRSYDRASERLDAAREMLHTAMRSAHAGGMSAYRIAKLTGVTERHVGRICQRE